MNLFKLTLLNVLNVDFAIRMRLKNFGNRARAEVRFNGFDDWTGNLIVANFLRFLKKNLRFWSKFYDFRCDFDKNRALKTLAQNLKSGSENLKS